MDDFGIWFQLRTIEAQLEHIRPNLVDPTDLDAINVALNKVGLIRDNYQETLNKPKGE